MYSVYTLTDPRDTTVRYIGMSQDAWRRYAMHLLIPGKKMSEKDMWIRELHQLHISPAMDIIETVETKDEAEKRESFWIQHYLSLNAPLTNISKTDKTIYVKRKPRTISAPRPVITRLEMDSSEMEELIREAGWTPIRRKRRKQGRIYVYAAQRQKGKVVERYIAPLSRIETMTSEQIISILQVVK